MEYRKLGNSNINLSAITFGAWAIGGWMWGGSDEKEAVNAIKKGFDLGITSIDTAPVYGFGLSEELVGKAVKGKRDKFQILTKYGLRWDQTKGSFYFTTNDNSEKELNLYKYSGKESIIHECELSLKRLQTDYIDLYQMHWPDAITPLEESMEAINQLLKDGKILAAGVSNYSSEQTKEALKYTAVVSNQLPYSMINRDNETSVFPYCIEQNVGIIAYSPLQRGILSGKIDLNHTFKKGDNREGSPYYKTENREKIINFLGKLKPIAEDRAVSLSQLVINWTISQKGIVSALVGARNSVQAEENAKAADFKLSNSEINTINTYLSQLKLDLS